MQKKHDLDVLTPDQDDQAIVHRIIYEELCLGEVKPESRTEYIKVIEKLAQQGAEAVILGCTEITLLVNQSHTSTPLFDTTALHAEAAVKQALAKDA
jgi:aspartate racemase